jgi:predicted nucleotidyltransferase
VTDLEAALIRLDIDLRALGIRWALVGGWAVSLRGEPRTTRDLDVTIAVSSDRQAERIARDLLHRGYDFLPESVLEQTTVHRLATVRFLSPATPEGCIVDLLFASSGIEPEVVAAASQLEVLPGLDVPVVQLGHLIALKVLAGRPQDLADLQVLRRYAEDRDLLLARESLELISRRGYDRGKDLLAEFARLV